MYVRTNIYLMYTHIYMYIYRERERERKKSHILTIYIYIRYVHSYKCTALYNILWSYVQGNKSTAPEYAQKVDNVLKQCFQAYYYKVL